MLQTKNDNMKRLPNDILEYIFKTILHDDNVCIYSNISNNLDKDLFRNETGFESI